MTSCESDLIMDTIWSLQMKTALQKIKPGDGEELSLDAITLAPGSRSSAVLCVVTQSCQTLCNPMDCSPPSSSVHGDSPGKNTGVGCHALLQGIFPTTGLNPGIAHCRQILYHLSHQSNPKILEWVAYSFSRGSCWPRNRIGVSCIAGGFFTSWATREAQNYHIIPQSHFWLNIWREQNRYPLEISVFSNPFQLLHNSQYIVATWVSIKLPTSFGSSLYRLCQSLWLCGSQQAVENS